MEQTVYTLTAAQIQQYISYLHEQERSAATVQKYGRDLSRLLEFLSNRPVSKPLLLDWKKQLAGRYAPTTVNTALAAANGLFLFAGWTSLIVKPIRLQKCLFRDEHRELNRAEYTRLVAAAQKKSNERLALLLQTICATGIRVSELRFITAEAVCAGKAEIMNKGKHRIVFLPNKLRRLLKKYLKKQKRTAGAVFVTRTGNPIDRSNIWREMKKLCESAHVTPKKVFPHNLRHLFARTYYNMERDLSRLADILGHSNINTTRIYTAESGAIHLRQMEHLGLILTT